MSPLVFTFFASILLSGFLLPHVNAKAVEHPTTHSPHGLQNTELDHPRTDTPGDQAERIGDIHEQEDRINGLSDQEATTGDQEDASRDESSNTTDFDYDMTTEDMSNCTFLLLEPEDVVLKKKNVLMVKAHNVSIPATGDKVHFEKSLDLCFGKSEALNKEILYVCDTWEYTEGEYNKLKNGSVEMGGELLEPGTFAFKDDKLYACADYADYGDDGHSKDRTSKEDQLSIYLGQAGSTVSIVALIAHLTAFSLVPSLRNLPGYNLAALSVGFLFAYSFSLIGQIPTVLGLECVLCGLLQQYFFLVAFFCMNTMAFDVWRTLNRATTQLTISSQRAKERQLVLYSLYSWGSPLIIVLVTACLDFSKHTPSWIRPQFGKDDICWMGNHTAKMVFFSGPAFSLFVLNFVFFIMSAFIIKNNTMKCTSDEQKQTARNNYVLYVRMAAMMGVTWLMGVIATLVGHFVVWIIADVLTSLQGLVVFLLFTCSRKVLNTVKERMHLKDFLHLGLSTPKTSTTDVPNSKGLFPWDNRTPKSSTTDIPNLFGHSSGNSRSPKTSTTVVPNPKDLSSSDKECATDFSNLRQLSSSNIKISTTDAPSPKILAPGDKLSPSTPVTDISSQNGQYLRDTRSRKTCTTASPNQEELDSPQDTRSPTATNNYVSTENFSSDTELNHHF